MALTKQPVNINFGMGVDTKTDPYQLQTGKFIDLHNSVFTTSLRLTKRPGFRNLTALPNAEQTTLTTLNDNLIATGSNLYALSNDTNQWINTGIVQPVELDVISMVRNSATQTSPDAAVSSTGLTCLTYIEGGIGYYQIIDSNTGQQIVGKTQLAATAGIPRVFLLNRYFIITFTATVSAASHLRYIAIPISNPTTPGSPQDIATTITALSIGYDGAVANNALYIAYSDTGTVVNIRYLSATLILSAAVSTAGQADLVSVTADITSPTPIIWLSFWDGTDSFVASFSSILSPIVPVAPLVAAIEMAEITSSAQNGLLTVIYETDNDYDSVGAYPTSNVRTDFLSLITVTDAGVVGSPSVILRSVGLASKSFIVDGTIYMIAVYGEVNQPTYFLIDSMGNIYMRLAYSNGGGYESNQILPTVSVVGSEYLVPYLFKDFLAPVNKGTNLPSGTPVNGIYTQTGINLAKFFINDSGQLQSEIARTLHLTGGQLWMYDASIPVEHGFQVWPENVAFTTSTSGGMVDDGTYYYSFTYEWTDNQGNLHRSAPSIPLLVTTTGGDTSENTLYVPTLRLTYKTDVRIVGYRWSAAQQVFYQFTSITTPVLNDPAVDYVTITDSNSDAAILGNVLLYTTGGVVENIAAPASIASALFKNRLFLIDAEDRNLLWYSKQVIEAVPVEMSDLFTLFIAPTSGAQGSTGPMTALSAMDDKLIIFKNNAIYYITGTGPDNTGANNDFSDPIFITSSVGCSNPQSIVLMPNGIMFQSNKGIWLLSRDLNTVYIGQDVEQFNSRIVMSAENIPGTTQVRFVLDNSVTLMYDYFYQQWGRHSNLHAISSTLQTGLMTYLNQYGQVLQENVGSFIDGSVPVLMSFTTAWINLAGLQGFERFYFMHLLGTYYSPYKLNVSIGYNYNPGPIQNVIVTPDNFSNNWGNEPVWGANGPWGGGQGTEASSDTSANIFAARIFPSQQKCMSFQVTVQELYDRTLGQAAGQGLSLSGLNLVVGGKRGFRTQRLKPEFRIMVQLIKYTPDMIDVIKKLHESQNYYRMEDIENNNLPKLGYIAKYEHTYAAAGFLRLMEGDYGMFDLHVTNGTLSSIQRHRAYQAVVDELIQAAKDMKLKGIFALTSDTGILKRAKSLGFLEIYEVPISLPLIYD